ncbi:WxL domain-containing protein [Levilactobacillus yiduensis]|uniref:WxL domain-containing protein n=1 Tax=Levilactobacillus yiduensis TaxID=2953880 RepID=UPI000EF336FE|nr:WxL domain-containing protein [Levilactobacillus yiduensis]AYM03907.1 hypothetical protein D8911_13310 [Levilactobacillus brevis]
MFKKTLGFVAVAAALTGLGLASTTTANADSTDPTTTNATVNLTAGTGTDGSVTLVSAPSISFKDSTLNGSAATAAATLTGNLIVNNAGGADGWGVTVSASPMKATNATTNKVSTLKGGAYTLSFAPSAIKSTTDTSADDTNKSTVPSSTDAKIDTGDDTTGSGTTILTAAAGDGVGTWNGGVKASDLTVPASAIEGSYTSTLTWALNNAPA